MKKGYKSCPYCAEEIREDAKKCRFCHEYLEEECESEVKIKNGNEPKLKTDENTKNFSNEDIKKEKKKNMTCGKRFGLYILYLFRDWIIYLILSAMTKGFGMWIYDMYSDAHFGFDMFVCFIIFIIETVRVISDCSKIKKGTYGK